MSQPPDDLMGYAKRHLLKHMAAAGMTQQEIEDRIAEIPRNNQYRDHYVTQYVESLPLHEREAATKRLLPKTEGGRTKVSIITIVDGEASIEVPSDFSTDDIDRAVKNAFSVQDDGTPHKWRSEPVE